jgi:hypothetical protein
MNSELIKQEILLHHRRETRIQSLGMLVGIAATMFVAMTIIDLTKAVARIESSHGKLERYILLDSEKVSVINSDIESLKTRVERLEDHHE